MSILNQLDADELQISGADGQSIKLKRNPELRSKQKALDLQSKMGLADMIGQDQQAAMAPPQLPPPMVPPPSGNPGVDLRLFEGLQRALAAWNQQNESLRLQYEIAQMGILDAPQMLPLGGSASPPFAQDATGALYPPILPEDDLSGMLPPPDRLPMMELNMPEVGGKSQAKGGPSYGGMPFDINSEEDLRLVGRDMVRQARMDARAAARDRRRAETPTLPLADTGFSPSLPEIPSVLGDVSTAGLTVPEPLDASMLGINAEQIAAPMNRVDQAITNWTQSADRFVDNAAQIATDPTQTRFVQHLAGIVSGISGKVGNIGDNVGAYLHEGIDYFTQPVGEQPQLTDRGRQSETAQTTTQAQTQAGQQGTQQRERTGRGFPIGFGAGNRQRERTGRGHPIAFGAGNRPTLPNALTAQNYARSESGVNTYLANVQQLADDAARRSQRLRQDAAIQRAYDQVTGRYNDGLAMIESMRVNAWNQGVLTPEMDLQFMRMALELGDQYSQDIIRMTSVELDVSIGREPQAISARDQAYIDNQYSQVLDRERSAILAERESARVGEGLESQAIVRDMGRYVGDDFGNTTYNDHALRSAIVLGNRDAQNEAAGIVFQHMVELLSSRRVSAQEASDWLAGEVANRAASADERPLVVWEMYAGGLDALKDRFENR